MQDILHHSWQHEAACSALNQLKPVPIKEVCLSVHSSDPTSEEKYSLEIKPQLGEYYIYDIVNSRVIAVASQSVGLKLTYYETLMVKIHNRGEIIELKLKRTEQYLASKNLPVWSAWKNEDPQLIPDVMNEVGDFIMYHDIEHSAAVVYFAKSDAIFGVIDTRFYINGLPLSELGPNIYHEVGGDYVKDRNVNDNSETFHDFATQLSHRRSDEEMNEMHSPPIRRHDCNPSSEPLDLSVPHFSESTDPEFKILYPEILVFETGVFPYSYNRGIQDRVSRAPFDVYSKRMVQDPYQALLGSIVHRRNAFADYITASHEIAHLMSIYHEPPKENTDDCTPRCSAIMQEFSNYCRNCLRWSQKSVGELKTYVRTSRNHCFLLNHPRSLFPYGQPIKTLTPSQQCICYGYHSHRVQVENPGNEVDTISCSAGLNCVINNVLDLMVPLPLDGTPCNTNKVCQLILLSLTISSY
ncbi:hypothetical protein PV328_005309 [Microctonus aethiopoides]|uniref:Peptidase M12B domain-containing protein n=1 Tax=Microctonus aethiopoides TaxID=144406 RepID=A0AA39FM31_9HYME|nr:hypothetical protein PV328_005309 [Microctonus aethiopoides]